MKKITLVLLLCASLFGTELQLKKGSVEAHTEMLMDSTINPLNNSLHADLTMDADAITTLRGKFWVEMNLFKSDNSDRDKNMYKDIEADKFKLASYTITNITKTEGEDTYMLEGILNFHGKDKPLNTKAKITMVGESLFLEATSMILVSDFGVKMPCMAFMCVRDRVDIFVKAQF